MSNPLAGVRITQVSVWRQRSLGANPPGPRLELYALNETPDVALALKVMAERRITVVVAPSSSAHLTGGLDLDGKPLYVSVELRNAKLERFRWVGDVPNSDREINETVRILLADLGAIYRELVG
jgi:hypothetical protein